MAATSIDQQRAVARKDRHRQLIAWIAALAILVMTIPSWASHGRVYALIIQGIELCAAPAAGAASPEGSKSDGTPAAAHVFDHCPYCSFHADGLGMPPSPLAWGLAPQLGSEHPTAFWSAPRTLHAWVRAQPRAPPQLS